jgi:ankyrin repeat protein
MSLFKRDVPVVDRIAAGRTDLVFDHVEQGGAATDRDGGGVALIAWCARYGDVSAIRFLLEKGERLDTLGTNLGLEGAAFHGHWRLCEFLIERGADVNRADPASGETPLHAALCKPNRPAYDLVVKVLLAAGADPNRPTSAGAETGSFMRDCRTYGETPLHRAAAFGSEAAIRMLLDAGAAKDAKDARGDSPLSWASWHTRPDAILRMLCYDDHFIRKDRGSTFDHGAGWGVMELDLLGHPA